MTFAPKTLFRLSALLRAQKKPQEAVDLLALCRTTYEAPLTADPTRADWVPLIQYHHGLAVRETGKLPEARAIFESISQKFPARPEGPEAAWRAGQCRREEALPKLEAAQKLLSKPDAKPDRNVLTRIGRKHLTRTPHNSRYRTLNPVSASRRNEHASRVRSPEFAHVSAAK